MSDLEEDVKRAKELVNRTYRLNNCSNKFEKQSSIYPFTTENINGYFYNFDFKDKSVLTVCSSGDHVFNSILYGAKKVDCFDINRLTKYYMLLKRAAIEKLDLDDFKKFFYPATLFTYDALSYNIYEKIRDSLNVEVQLFWDSIYSFATSITDGHPGYRIRNSSLFNEEDEQTDLITILNSYLKKENYNKLKDVMGGCSIDFLESDILALPKNLNTSYDIMLMSNITDYIDGLFEENSLVGYRDFIINDLDKFLNKYGEIILSYIFWYSNKETLNIRSINSPYQRKVIFKDLFSTITFSGDDPVNKDMVDAVLVYRKNKI